MSGGFPIINKKLQLPKEKLDFDKLRCFDNHNQIALAQKINLILIEERGK